jgi:HAD superfamily hydrolase (TIGR01509 family)
VALDARAFDGRAFDGIVFDFDGLILDTESNEFDAWDALHRRYTGTPLERRLWLESIGRKELVGDPIRALRERADFTAIREEYRLDRDRRNHASDVRAGVLEWLTEARRRRIPVAMATSSGDGWADGHLCRLGLRDHFVAISCVRDGVPGKPAPDLYLLACEALGAEPARTLAIEDSPPGVRAAKAAGLWCLAVPSPMTAGLDFGGADLVVESLAETSYDAVVALLATERGALTRSSRPQPRN